MHYYPNIGKKPPVPTHVFSSKGKKVKKKKKKKKEKKERKEMKRKVEWYAIFKSTKEINQSSGVYNQKCFTKNAAKRRPGLSGPVCLPI
ncbi:hypothetical protein BO70DRAFT_131654 [Aspergillus heteromorphus CBS 117.55]|uniref:Uncharacterized protein n=1 Tax=Aspergillus heteromorphus CBS 117.55 TaxID=1448321 RepID=A0A317WXL8_9EURO|nr:uncharacterized protein BO70DRAFT_131654 [Aspergillus heteromorphus CBS 117.55]PWY89967.1 hypothetical protein BO70DRAFT_131654 [Aspergillus heteromorphus CBS 117.55]